MTSGDSFISSSIHFIITFQIAPILANRLEVKAEPIESKIAAYVDILFVGGGVYMGKPDKSLYNFLEELNPENVGQIVCFSTTGSMASTIKQIRNIASKKD